MKKWNELSYNVQERVVSEVSLMREFLWKYNRASGLWSLQREVAPDTRDNWLKLFQEDEPKEHFVVSSRSPKGRPCGFAG